MKEIKLTRGYVALVDDVDYERLSQHKWHATSQQGGPYAARYKLGGGRIYMHRVLIGAEDGQLVDHINGNGLDNRRTNLRFATVALNRVNTKADRDSTSGYKGVTLTTEGRWRAQITFNKKKYHLGTFETKEEAARVFNKAAKEFRGEFAVLNDVQEVA